MVCKSDDILRKSKIFMTNNKHKYHPYLYRLGTYVILKNSSIMFCNNDIYWTSIYKLLLFRDYSVKVFIYIDTVTVPIT